MTAVWAIGLLVGGGAFAVLVLAAMGQVRTPPTPPTPGQVRAAAALSLGSILLGSYLLVDAVTASAPAADRTWYERGDHLLDAPVGDWLPAAAIEQLAAAAVFVFNVQRDDDDFDIFGSEFMKDAAILRHCIITTGQTEGVNPDTPAVDLAALCVLAANVGEEQQSQDATVRAPGTTSATPWHREGAGAMVLDKPAAVRRVRITAQYDGWTQNFAVICGEVLTVLEGLGTDERSVHYAGTHRMDCEEVEIQKATGVRWSFTEVP